MGFSSFFSRKSDIYKPSEYLLNHPFKDKYFYRLMQFGKLDNETVYAIDNKRPRMITFDPWPQRIFLSATGLKTIYQFTIEMALLYRGRVPALLEQTIISEADGLIAEGCIALSDDRILLDEKFLIDVNKQILP